MAAKRNVEARKKLVLQSQTKFVLSLSANKSELLDILYVAKLTKMFSIHEFRI